MPFGISSTIQTALKTVLPGPGCSFDTSVLIVKMLKFGPYPRSMKSEFLGYGPGHPIFKKHPLECAAKVENTTSC